MPWRGHRQFKRFWYPMLIDENRWYMESHIAWEAEVLAVYNDSNGALTSLFRVGPKCSLGLPGGGIDSFLVFLHQTCKVKCYKLSRLPAANLELEPRGKATNHTPPSLQFAVMGWFFIQLLIPAISPLTQPLEIGFNRCPIFLCIPTANCWTLKSSKGLRTREQPIESILTEFYRASA